MIESQKKSQEKVNLNFKDPLDGLNSDGIENKAKEFMKLYLGNFCIKQKPDKKEIFNRNINLIDDIQIKAINYKEIQNNYIEYGNFCEGKIDTNNEYHIYIINFMKTVESYFKDILSTANGVTLGFHTQGFGKVEIMSFCNQYEIIKQSNDTSDEVIQNFVDTRKSLYELMHKNINKSVYVSKDHKDSTAYCITPLHELAHYIHEKNDYLNEDELLLIKDELGISDEYYGDTEEIYAFIIELKYMLRLFNIRDTTKDEIQKDDIILLFGKISELPKGERKEQYLSTFFSFGESETENILKSLNNHINKITSIKESKKLTGKKSNPFGSDYLS